MNSEQNKPLIQNLDSTSNLYHDRPLDSADVEKADIEEDHLDEGYDQHDTFWRTVCQKLYRKAGRYILLSLLTLVLIAAMFSIWRKADYIHYHHDQHIHQDMNMSATYSKSGLALTCGSTNEEALANNCVFDVITYAWTPPACYFPDLAADVVSTASRYAPPHKAGVFAWYGDVHGHEPVPQDAAVLSERAEIWATRYWHQAHCLYFWRLLSRAIEHAHQYGVGESYVLSQAVVTPHTFHCNDMLADTEKKGTDLIRTLRVYGTCVTLDADPDPSLEHGDLVVDPNEKSGAGK